ncbi:uncharacterized protein A1O5_13046, partial [Cladophialophora psammophila CBS 110553]
IVRHERLYQCQEAGHELRPGFTYHGGLLRHEQEVHKMYLSAKKTPIFCSFPNRPRSSGKPYMRKENFEDHKRRIHKVEKRPSNPAASQPQP